MQAMTMDIQKFPTQEEAEKAGYGIPITDDQAELLRPLSRRDRRAWLRKEKKRLAKIAKGRGREPQGQAPAPGAPI